MIDPQQSPRAAVTAPLFRYRVPLIRRLEGYSGRAELCEPLVVHTANATHAQLAARLVSGAEVALEPERLGEVLS